MTPSPNIGGTAFNATMGYHGGGFVTPHWRIQKTAADGTSYFSGECWMEWEWDALTGTDYQWLLTKYLTTPTTFELPTDDTKAAFYTFTAGAMYRPTCGRAVGPAVMSKIHVEFHALSPVPY